MRKQGRDIFNRYKKIILLLVRFSTIIPRFLRKKMLVSFRNKKGKTGILLRYILLKSIAREVGDNVAIYENVYLNFPENMSFGNNVSIHPMCYIEGYGGVKVGDDVSIAHGTTILSTTHLFNDLAIPIKNQGFESKCTYINDGVWIGAKATILYGVNVGANSIIGANSLVNKDVKENTIVGGVPSKVIKVRG